MVRGARGHRVNLQFGLFVQTEIIVDLQTPGITVTLADSPTIEATLRLLTDPKSHSPHHTIHPYQIGDGSKSYSIEPVLPVDFVDGVYLWSWMAYYHWIPPKKKVTTPMRRVDLALARLARGDYRFEVTLWDQYPSHAIQYVLDKPTARPLESAFIAIREAL